MRKEIQFENKKRFLTGEFCDFDPDLESSHMSNYSLPLPTELSLHIKLHSNWKNCLCMYARTCVHMNRLTDGRTSRSMKI